ncbi:unnamed protein product [Peniophora sp. CBMAI 1063]|nr:unnamed protein product [Peniophora sp. CBMAI 1063]
MKAIIPFSGLFAATVAIFLVDSHKSLSPGPSADSALTNALLAQLVLASSVTPVTAVDIEPVRPTHTAIVVNTLWYLSLVISLICAVLATMVQDWLKESAVEDVRPSVATIERHGLTRLYSHTALERSRLDHLPTCVVGLMHSAVALFLIGLSLYLFPLHSTPGFAVAIASGLGALFYGLVSVAPLIDQEGPYYTPLSYILSVAFYSSAVLIASTLMYIVNVCAAAKDWISNKHVAFGDLDPRQVFMFLGDPALSVRIIGPLCHWVLRSRSMEELDELLERAFEPLQGRPVLAGRALAFLATRMRAYLLKHPEAMRYLSRCLLSLEYQSVCDFFIRLRSSRAVMERLVAVFQNIDSVFAAVGAMRFLQMLVSAESHVDNQSQAHSNQDHRWRYMEPVLAAFPAFAKQVGEQADKALRQRDPVLHTAVASFRWTLIQSLGAVEGEPCTAEQPGFLAKTSVHSMLITLESVESLRMRTASATDHPQLETLLQDSSTDPRLELSTRNALTLLDCVQLCDWQPGDWHKPDLNYLRKGMPSMWEWPRLYGCHGSGTSPLASKTLRELLSQDRVKVSMQRSSATLVPDALRLEPVAIHALRDLASVVAPLTPEFAAKGQARELDNALTPSENSSVDVVPKTTYIA